MEKENITKKIYIFSRQETIYLYLISIKLKPLASIFFGCETNQVTTVCPNTSVVSVAILYQGNQLPQRCSKTQVDGSIVWDKRK